MRAKSLLHKKIHGRKTSSKSMEETQSSWLDNTRFFRDQCKDLVGLDLTKIFELHEYDTAFWNLHDSSNLSSLKCKCCSGNALVIGLVDFNKSCHDRHGDPAFSTSDISVPYHKCESCGFIFSVYCDPWNTHNFAEHIYNSEYEKADGVIPGFEEGVNDPKKSISYQNGLNLINVLGITPDQGLKILDFGSGGDPGPTGLAFLDRGFKLQSYEPYLNDVSQNIGDQSFDIIFAIEVIEHIVDLDEALDFFDKHLSSNGLLHIQTGLHPHPSGKEIMNSWYIAPRNGHFSVFTQRALEQLFKKVGINIISTSNGIFGFKDKPNFVNNLITAIS